MRILVALVENRTGVLNRITSLFRKRNFNIDSLSVGRTDKDDISRMTIVIKDSETNIEQVIKQLYKIVNVIKVSDVTKDEKVVRETLLIKVSATKSKRSEVLQFTGVFKGKIIDINHESAIIELTSRPEKVESFIDIMKSFGIKEMVRTGAITMNRGKCI